jgi:hypothetical protein
MIGYQFSLHTDTEVEELGSMALVDDAEALAFARGDSRFAGQG